MFQGDESSERDKDLSTRVNSARLSDYVGKHVRLPCKALKMSDGSATVEASDGGHVTVHLNSVLLSILPLSEANIGRNSLSAFQKAGAIVDPYIEVVGKVMDASTVQMLACVNLGAELDMKMVNDTIELIHDPRFYSKMFV
ncbi:hypothetical protein B0H34DRAFT_798760 [Crassisporium funariophilum]|nr:hypothetical protein B0H34DRAFT_798760 [Crassisporium funariophilum]